MADSATPVTRYLLQSLIAVIPPFTTLEPYRDSNLNNWRKTGSYHLLNSSKNSITLAASNPREYAAALFADAQHLMNHVAEHRAHLINSVSTGNEPSPTWTFVTIYYMALFAAMAWTRAANQSVIYLDTDAIKEFCGGSSIKPGGGAFVLTAEENSNSGQFEIHIVKYKSHFHEAVWAKSMDEANSAYNWISAATSSRAASSEELLHMRALNLFRKTRFKSGSAWPSQLRNALNYRPGHGYRSILKNNHLKIGSRLKKSSFPHLSDLITYGERALNNFGTNKDPTEVSNDAIDLLVTYGMIFEKYTEQALDEICKIQNISSSAKSQRAKFNKANCQDPETILKRFRPRIVFYIK